MIYLYSLYDKIIIIFSVYISKKYKNLYCKIILVGGIFGEKLILICIICFCIYIYIFFKSRYVIFEKKNFLRFMYVCFVYFLFWISMLFIMIGISL